MIASPPLDLGRLVNYFKDFLAVYSSTVKFQNNFRKSNKQLSNSTTVH
jgi:hypothetical protein